MPTWSRKKAPPGKNSFRKLAKGFETEFGASEVSRSLRGPWHAGRMLFEAGWQQNWQV